MLRALAWLILTVVCVFSILGFVIGYAVAGDIPHAAQQYRYELTRQARLVWGINAPIATMAAQVHQESAWNPNAVSHVGAQGLAQFMPATAAWMPQIDNTLHRVYPTNPSWALRALARYDHWLYSRLI